MPPDAPADTMLADVTVVMPAYRAADTIARSLGSIAAQTLKPRAVAVVDDGYDDGTAEAAEAMRPALAPTELILERQQNKGPGAARNRGIALAETAFIAFLDADDEWLPEKLAEMMTAIEADDLSFASHNYIEVRDGSATEVDCGRRFPGVGDPFLALFQGNFIDTSSVVARRDAVNAAGGFDDTLPSAQDYKLWLSLARQPDVRFRVVRKPLSRYHIQPVSISTNVPRREECAIRILGEQLPALQGRSPRPLRDALRRRALIGRESWQMYRLAGRTGRGILALASLPFALLGLLAQYRAVARNPFHDTRDDVATRIDDPKERNRQWWEEMPMTYADWEAENRLPQSREEFEAIRARLLETSPFFREVYDWSQVSGKRTLDLGCGSGVFSTMLAEAGADVTSVDLTETGVRLARRFGEILDLPIRVGRMDAERLGIADRTFDYVFSWGVLHHTPDTEKAFSEAARVMAPGGRGLIMVYHRTSAVYYLKGLWWLIVHGKIFRGDGFESVQGYYTDGYYHRHFTRSELARILKAAGFDDVDVFVTQMQKKILPGIPDWLDAWLKPRFGWLICAYVGRKPADS